MVSSVCYSSTFRPWYVPSSSSPPHYLQLPQYNIASLIFSWFALANLWLTFSIIIDLTVDQGIIVFGTAAIVSAFTPVPIVTSTDMVLLSILVSLG